MVGLDVQMARASEYAAGVGTLSDLRLVPCAWEGNHFADLLDLGSALAQMSGVIAAFECPRIELMVFTSTSLRHVAIVFHCCHISWGCRNEMGSMLRMVQCQ